MATSRRGYIVNPTVLRKLLERNARVKANLAKRKAQEKEKPKP